MNALPKEPHPKIWVANKSRFQVAVSSALRDGGGERRVSGFALLDPDAIVPGKVGQNSFGDAKWRGMGNVDSYLVVIDAANSEARSLAIPIPRFVEIEFSRKELDDLGEGEINIELFDDHAIVNRGGAKSRWPYMPVDLRHPVFAYLEKGNSKSR
jgi:hypothetical protein